MNIHVGMLLATIHLGMLTPSASLSVDAARVVRQLHPTPTHRTAQPAMLALANHPSVDMLAAQEVGELDPLTDEPQTDFAFAEEAPDAAPFLLVFEHPLARRGERQTLLRRSGRTDKRSDAEQRQEP